MHGKAVAACTPYIPGSFDRPPRNPAEKINSGYKAWEFLLYLYGLGPCFFFGILPDKYWEHYCLYVRAVQLLIQKSYRLHFIRPSIHTPSHVLHETARIGPGIIYSQWTMERTIGNLGQETKQHSNPYANISQRGVRRCQVNALLASVPDLIPNEGPPQGSRQLDNGYIMLTATDNVSREVTLQEARALREFHSEHGDIRSEDWEPKVVRWARIKLPNGQIARSQWKEDGLPLSNIRMSRNVKTLHALAVGSFYGPPHEELLRRSSNTYYTVQHQRDVDVRAFPISNPQYIQIFNGREPDGTHNDRWFKMQKPGIVVSAV
ncbi:hypothetical protein F5878DRAFT_654799 [Lentinula raphanica]|uniref:Uncharacterized protein n=1 Tax=Lentinula raphanica TaxID=153919 RepID=A0AA38U3H7_9AGAR|nr:hypothetical protein F5878DRAFT_654799 [Lentinula raphanica]